MKANPSFHQTKGFVAPITKVTNKPNIAEYAMGRRARKRLKAGEPFA